VEAEVFQQQGLAGLEIVGQLQSDRADAVRGESDILVGVEDAVEQRAQAHGDRAKADGRNFFALGTAEVRGEDDAGLAAQSVLDGGNGFADARVVGDDAVLERDVEVDADQNTFAGEVEVADGQLRHCEKDNRLRDVRWKC
jgi:hypothetical protein